jgi:hypothetical protein
MRTSRQKPAPAVALRRCAIYTRKSTTHGLDQEFSSLDAQWEACGYVTLGDELHEGEHEPVVDRELFERVQTLRHASPAERASRGRNPDYLLRGLVHCPCPRPDGTPCGFALTPGSTSAGTDSQRGPVLRARFRRVRGRGVELRRGPPPSLVPRKSTRRPAYVARLLALAHQLRRLLERGEVSSIGEFARRLEVSQPRVTQILNLTYLAPSIQAEVLALEAVDGVEPMTQRPLREVLKEVGWVGQRTRWRVARRSPG